MVALDLRDGSLKWNHLSFPNGGSFSPSDDTLYASEYSIEGTPILHAIDGKTSFDMRTGELLGHHSIALAEEEKFDLSVWGHEVLYVRSSVHEGDPYSSGSSTSFTRYIIHAIRLVDGATSWSYDLGSLVDVQEPITSLLLAP